MRGLSLVAASGGHSSSRCAGLSLSRPLLLWSTGSRRADSAIVAYRPSRSTACGIFPDQGSNPCPLHWQADSQPLRHQGSPRPFLLNVSAGKFSWGWRLVWLLHLSEGSGSKERTAKLLSEQPWPTLWAGLLSHYLLIWPPCWHGPYN